MKKRLHRHFEIVLRNTRATGENFLGSTSKFKVSLREKTDLQ